MTHRNPTTPTQPAPAEDAAIKVDADRYARYAEDADAQFDVKRAKFEYTKERASIELDRARWRNRRWMAWISLAAMLAATYALFFTVSETRLKDLGDVISWFYMAMASVIGTYLGTTTWAYVSTKGKARRGMGMGNNPWSDYDGGGYGTGYGGGRLDDPALNKDAYYTER